MAKKIKNVEFFEGIGRRKESIARVRLYLKGTSKLKPGDFAINEKAIEKVYSNYQINYILSPLRLTDSINRFAVSVRVSGGGKNGQLEAIVHGISRSMVKVDPTYKITLKKAGLLTRDSRKRERRKVGTGGKARRAKQSPKR
jgi:small subunit ribosomal protein S9